MSKSTIKTAAALDTDAPFWARLQERLTYLRNRRWVQISAALLLLVLTVWGFFTCVRFCRVHPRNFSVTARTCCKPIWNFRRRVQSWG